LQSGGACRSRHSRRAGCARFTASAARGAICNDCLAFDIAGFERHGAIHRVIGEAEREAAVAVAADGVAVVGRHHRARARGLPRNDQLAGLDCGHTQADAEATMAILGIPVPSGFAKRGFLKLSFGMSGFVLAALRLMTGLVTG
jgi:hypothetical protein